MEHINYFEVILGFVLGILGSYIFWRYLLHLKPKISISPKILAGLSRKVEGKRVHRIKFVNNGNRSIVDINMRLTLCQLEQLEKGDKILVVKQMIFKNDYPLILGPKRNLGQHWKFSPIHKRAIPLAQDILNSLNDKCRLVLTVSCRDSISSTTIPIRIVYQKKDIEEGDFRYDLSFHKIDDNVNFDIIDYDF